MNCMHSLNLQQILYGYITFLNINSISYLLSFFFKLLLFISNYCPQIVNFDLIFFLNGCCIITSQMRSELKEKEGPPPLFKNIF